MSRLGNIGGRLYRGEVSFDFVGKQKLWYRISGAILLVSVVALVVFHLNFSIDFKGGSVYQFKAPAATNSQVTNTVVAAGAGTTITVQKEGSTSWTVQTPVLKSSTQFAVQNAIAARFHLPPKQVSLKSIGPSWGSQISQKAHRGADRLPGRDRALPVDRLRVADGDRGSRGAGARHRDHDRRLRAGALRGQPGHRDRAADHPRLLAVRHRGGLRQGQGEYGRTARDPADHLQRGRQPGAEPDPGPVDQHLADRAAARASRSWPSASSCSATAS